MSDGAAVAEHAQASLPGEHELRALLVGLLDKPVVVQALERPVLRGRDVRVVASYVDDTQRPRAVLLLDVGLGCAFGAALALVPPVRCQEALASGQVPSDLADNTREVLNIAASLFNEGAAHLKLAGTWVAPEPVPDEVVALLGAGGRRADLHVEVPGYSDGQLVVLLH